MNPIEQEFTKVVREHKGTIYTVCYMFSKDEDEVADLFQEILINIWKGLEKFRGDSSMRTWIWRISFNTCVSYEKRKSRRGSTISCPQLEWRHHGGLISGYFRKSAAAAFFCCFGDNRGRENKQRQNVGQHHQLIEHILQFPDQIILDQRSDHNGNDR